MARGVDHDASRDSEVVEGSTDSPARCGRDGATDGVASLGERCGWNTCTEMEEREKKWRKWRRRED
jgi:hypothetical protein